MVAKTKNLLFSGKMPNQSGGTSPTHAALQNYPKWPSAEFERLNIAEIHD